MWQEENRHLLVDRLKAADKAAANELVDTYYRQIYLFMRRLGHNEHVSEELTQECFLQAWQHIGQVRDDGALKSWLYRIAMNVSNGYWRRERYATHEDYQLLNIADPSGQSSDAMEYRERLKELQNAVHRLPMKYRQVIILHYFQRLRIEEAARAIGIMQGSFKSRLNRALKVLRKRMVL